MSSNWLVHWSDFSLSFINTRIPTPSSIRNTLFEPTIHNTQFNTEGGWVFFSIQLQIGDREFSKWKNFYPGNVYLNQLKFTPV